MTIFDPLQVSKTPSGELELKGNPVKIGDYLRSCESRSVR